MPLLKLETTVALSDNQQEQLLGALSKLGAQILGKPEQYVMATLTQPAMVMSGNDGDAAFLEIRSIGGLNGEVNRRFAQQVCKLLNDSLGIPPERVYLNFTDVDAGNWGWNGNTFG